MLPPLDTIAALATARGQAALAIVRASGPNAIAVVDRCFLAKELAVVPSHTAHVGTFTTPGGERLDQVVVTVFRSPTSATGEDVVEVSCHGGDVASQLVLQAFLAAGARLARPGEFTERAFLNGKLDLAQAEAVADLIHARSTVAHRVALHHLQGRYSDVLSKLREELLRLCALVELELDFSEEDVAFADPEALHDLLDQSEALLAELLGSYRLGRLVRDGVCVVIGGRPNAGKSTLLNALLGQDRAIVSDTPGTTRDAIEAELEIEGVSFRFTDTAGLREAPGAIESEGVRRAARAAREADLYLYLYDATLGLASEEAAWLEALSSDRPDLPVLRIANKADLLSPDPASPEGGGEGGGRGGALSLSAQRALSAPPHLDPLRRAIVARSLPDLTAPDASPVITRQRHRQHLSQALDALRRARAGLRASASGEVLAVDLRFALREIGAVTGEVTNEDVLGTIFSSFCIGK